MSIQAMKQALEFIKATNKSSSFLLVPASQLNQTITALSTAIAEAEKQKPVAWISKHGVVYPLDAKDEVHPINDLQPLYTALPAAQPAVLAHIEQYRLQMAGISTAATGYWKEGDGIHPDYDTLALRDVAKLYAKYDALYKAAQRQPLTDKQIGKILDDPNIAEAHQGNWRVLPYAYARAIEAAHGIGVSQ